MPSTRLSRFQRANTVPPITLTSRDLSIIRLVGEYRFLRSNHFASLLGGSKQQILRRLNLLYHHGFLERPYAQVEYFQHHGPHHMAYGLGNKGGNLLREELHNFSHKISWGEKNRAVGRIFLEHALFVSDILFAIEMACRDSGVRYVRQSEVLRQSGRRKLKWNVTVPGKGKLGIIPDQVFALDIPGEGGTFHRAYFFLEADRGTMPVVRHTLGRTSIFRKLLAYGATWEQNLHLLEWGFHRMRVLFVTQSRERRDAMALACKEIPRGHGLFLFGDKSILQENIFSAVWHTTTPGENGSLVE